MSATLSIIFSLFIIEVLLSIDNALVNATIANSLPEDKRKLAIRIGIMLGAGFRLVALFFASFIIKNLWIKVYGGFYLIYLAMKHLGKEVNEEGNVVRKQSSAFSGVIWQIALADIVFSVDNVISAVSFSPKFEIVVLGVFIGTLSMLFITPILSKLVHHYKGMPQAAYTIVGFVGVTLIVETLYDMHLSESLKFIIILSITLFTVMYEHSLALRKFSTPLLRSAQFLIALPFDLYSVLFARKI
jgi:YkoY family integral membrane protein